MLIILTEALETTAAALARDTLVGESRAHRRDQARLRKRVGEIDLHAARAAMRGRGRASGGRRVARRP